MEGYIYLKKINDNIIIEKSKLNPIKIFKPIIMSFTYNLDIFYSELIVMFNKNYKKISYNIYNGNINEMINDFLKICENQKKFINNNNYNIFNDSPIDDNIIIYDTLYDLNDDKIN